MLKRRRPSPLPTVLVLLGALACAQPATADIIPPERRTTWNPGLNAVGGIPYRTTVCSTLSPSGGDDTAALQAALDNCPANQVVKLTAGTFRVSSTLWPRSNTTLRGSGPGNTILLGAGNPGAIVFVGRLWYNWSQQTLLTADAVKGATSVTTAANPGWQVGEIVNVNEKYDPARTAFAQTGDQNGDYQGWGEGRKGPQANSRPIGQAMEIASISGSGPYTVTFTTPLHITLRTSRSAHIARLTGGVGAQREWVGVEDLTLSDGSGGDDGGPLSFSVTKYCWAKNVEVKRTSASAVLFKSAVRCELRDSYVHTTLSPSPGGGGYGLAIDSYSADNLIENNIVWNFNKVMVMRSSGGGNVIGYNYMEDGWGDGYPNIVETGLNAAHMTTPHYELFEGNQSFNFSSDGTWGNSIYITAFRNHMTGRRRSISPLSLTDAYNRRAAEVVADHWWYTFAGNVLGTLGQSLISPQTTWVADYNGTDGDQYAFMWKIGTPWPWNPRDATVVARTIRHGNFDYVSNSVVWDPGNPDHDLPPSLYLTSKPAFFGANPWPWVDPTGATKVHTLPARARFDAGTPNPTSYSLTVAKAGTGSGTVTSSPAGINCGATCSATYATGTVVNLTATANSGSAFSGWSGACSGTGTCQVTMNTAKTVTATFDQLSLSINDVTLGEGDAGSQNAVFTVTLSAASTQTVSVSYATADGSATAPSDYAAVSGSLSFSPGSLQRTISVAVHGDTSVEPDETFRVNLTSPTGAVLAKAQGQGTILNDDVTPPPSGPTPYDFNGDGKPDILWRHDTSGDLSVWLMDGATQFDATNLSVVELLDMQWQIQGVADFNTDGHADILWRNQITGDLTVWFMNGTTQTGESALDPPGVADLTWHIRGIGDFNGDGKPDILWRHEYGSIYVWFMDGTSLVSGSYLDPGFVLPPWRIRGTGDFNLDGKPDILWQHDAGSVYVWLMDGTSLVSGSYLNPGFVGDLDWEVARVADADGNGYVDILWHHQSTGYLYIWFMVGIDLMSGTYLAPSQLPDTLWKVMPRTAATWGGAAARKLEASGASGGVEDPLPFLHRHPPPEASARGAAPVRGEGLRRR